MLNVAIIGAGRIGRLHAENLCYRIPQTQVVGIADVQISAAEETAARLNIPFTTADYRELLAKPNVDVVVICSATDTHTEIIIESAKAGKQIFCEKPIDLSLSKIDAALEAVDKAGVKMQIGFNRRFDPNFRRVRTAIERGEMGTPHRLHIISRDPAPPPLSYVKVSGGMFVDMTIHDFDMARYLIGSEVEEIYTLAGVMVDPAIGAAGDVDSALVTLKFANGVIGSIDNSRQAVYGYDQRVEVFGSGGKIETDNNYPNAAHISTAQNVYRDLPLNFFLERYSESYVSEILSFVDALEHDKPVSVGGIDGRQAVVMGMAARKSYLEHRPVRLDEI
ncbi:MAG: inositol 2-dehydrogenase [Chloroflexi bacterium OLB15]|nr:MAG: inositol 2-dehydrogenase [Chloroflexi bacterium OLB15]